MSDITDNEIENIIDNLGECIVECRDDLKPLVKSIIHEIESQGYRIIRHEALIPKAHIIDGYATMQSESDYDETDYENDNNKSDDLLNRIKNYMGT